MTNVYNQDTYLKIHNIHVFALKYNYRHYTEFKSYNTCNYIILFHFYYHLCNLYFSLFVSYKKKNIITFNNHVHILKSKNVYESQINAYNKII